jgi:formiminotetrahydrofolate cyclodeaminase
VLEKAGEAAYTDRLMLIDNRVADFVEAVAAKTPTPGGGSVSALVGTLGAALGVMAARYSDDPEAERAMDGVKGEFLPLVDADARAYGQVNAAMALPRGTDDEKRRRKAALQNALGEAAEVPLKAMMVAVRGLEALRALAPRCNKHLVSDLVSAALFLEAGLTGCGENVRVNAASIADEGRRDRLLREHARLASSGAEHRERVLQDAKKPDGGK